MTITYETWLDDVVVALDSINMTMDDWQRIWPFDFRTEFAAGTTANDTAMKANRFWWYRQNKSINQECKKIPNYWLPRDHHGECQHRT